MSNKPFNDFVLVPELVIEKIITQSLLFIRNDYQSIIDEGKDETLSYLYLLCNGVGIQRLDLFKQAKKIFLADPEDPKRINVYLQFPQKIEGSVAICITHSGEQHGQNTLGVGQDSEIYDDYFNNDEVADSYRNIYSRRYTATYQIICTGDNSNEAIIVYTLIKSLFIALEATSHLNAMGFQNCKISGADLQIKQEMTKNLFAKTISLNFEYEFKVPNINRAKFANGIIFNGIIKE